MSTIGHANGIATLAPVVLASGSPRRAAILREVGLEFVVAPSEIDESVVSHLAPVEEAVALATLKAETVSRSHRQSLVIAADTVVDLYGVSIGKPANEQHAIEMLSGLSGRTHLVHTGVAVSVGGKVRSGVATTEVRMRVLSSTEIKSYVRSGAPMDKAGAYGIQDTGFSPVDSIDGSYLNVVGLPVGLLAKLLHETGQIDASSVEVMTRSDAS